jgi:hypothetical protein
MKNFLTKMGVISIIATLAIVSFSFSAQAEKKKIEGAYRHLRMISQSTPLLGDPKGKFLGHLTILRMMTSSNPDFNEVPVLVYEQYEEGQGKGIHRGYMVIFHKNGDESYQTIEGTHQGPATEGEIWEGTSEGRYTYIGGTGKFKNIKGGGTYKSEFGTKEGKFFNTGTYTGEEEY